jgi:hypothetical protein
MELVIRCVQDMLQLQKNVGMIFFLYDDSAKKQEKLYLLGECCFSLSSPLLSFLNPLDQSSNTRCMNTQMPRKLGSRNRFAGRMRNILKNVTLITD